MLESAGVIKGNKTYQNDSVRRRRVIRELKRRHPSVTVDVVKVDGKEQWRVKGDQADEQAAVESLRELLQPDSIVQTTDPFEVPKEELDILWVRMEERGEQLEPYCDD